MTTKGHREKTQREQIADYLRDHPGTPPAAVAKALRLPAPSVRRVFQELRKTPARKDEPTPPPGFVKVGISGAADAATLMRERLKAAAEKLGGDAHVTVHRNLDGSVDGELRLKVPRTGRVSDLFIDTERALDTKGLSRDVWISAGERYTIKEDEEVYRRYKGMNEVRTFYQRINRANVAEVMLAARTTMTKGMEKKYGRRAESVYVRLHWNPTNEKPHRERTLGGKKK